ncbi:MAG: tail fiber domain-containing protein [Prosthecobacter sp.]|uniref:tail fiber domain-containing protein n=1 Tax=Prosthecobacter sp. TaxID=1965333 RepID=UPI0038FEE5BB
MKHSAILLTTLGILLGSLQAQTTVVPPFLNYQGKVSDSAGTGLGTGTPINRKVVFRLYDASAGGTRLWTEEQTAIFSNGQFSVLLGNGTAATGTAAGEIRPALDTLFTSGSTDRYLELTVDNGDNTINASDLPIAPRQRMTTTAYSFRARTADSLTSGATTGALTVNGAVTISSGAAVTGNISGAAISGSSLSAGTGTITGGTINGTSLALNGGPITNAGAINGTSLALNGGNISTTGSLSADGAIIGGSTLKTWGSIQMGFFPTNYNQLSLGGGNAWGYLYGSFAGYGDGVHFGYNHYKDAAGSNAGSNGAATSRISAGYGTVSLATATSGQPTDRLLVNSSGAVTIPGTLGVTGAISSASISSGTISATGAISTTAGFAIGLSAPTAPFKLQTKGGGGANLWEGAGAFGGTGGTALIGQFDNKAVVGAHSGALDAWNDLYINPGGGNVLIGGGTGSAPTAKLEVKGFASTSIFRLGYLQDGSFNDSNGTSAWNLSIRADNVVSSATFVVESDERIKNIESISDGQKDLDTLRQIQITNYSLKDKVAKGTQSYKKVIAQQVEKVYPLAVRQTTDVVPDIYQKATIKDGWIALKTDLKKGDRVRLIAEKSEGVHEVLDVAQGRFRTAFKPEGKDIFVYGREVKDFRVVDYEAISMLNVSATQQLKKEKDAEVKALTSENADLRARVAALEAKDKARDAKLAAIEALLSEEKPTVRTVSLKKTNDAE